MLLQGVKGVDPMSEQQTNCDICNYDYHCDGTIEDCDCSCANKIIEEANIKWFTERGSVWRTLENKRLKLYHNGHITTKIISRVPTKKDEREFEFSHQLPRGNPNLLPALPKEYVK